jgi:hypothetical protein
MEAIGLWFWACFHKRVIRMVHARADSNGSCFPVGTNGHTPRSMRPFADRSLTPILINELISVIPREKFLTAPIWLEDTQLEMRVRPEIG